MNIQKQIIGLTELHDYLADKRRNFPRRSADYKIWTDELRKCDDLISLLELEEDGRLTDSQRSVLAALKLGAMLWNYSTQNTSFLLVPGCVHHKAIQWKTMQALLDAELIMEDPKTSVYRDVGGSDIHYRLTELGIRLA